MGVVKDENHFIVKGFMINQLELKGVELMVYAIIYGFSQDGNCKFTGSRQYLADFTGSSKSTIDRVLKELTDKELITKETTNENNITFNKYYINEDTIVKMSNRCIQNEEGVFNLNRGCIQNEEGGVFNLSTNNKDIYNSINNNSNNSNINNNLDNNINNINIYDYIENNYGRTLSPIEYEEISTWEDNELTRYAVKQSILIGVYNIKYISTILHNYKMRNIKTVQQAQEEEKRFKEKNTRGMTASEKRQEMYRRIEEKYKNGDTRNN